MRLLYRIVTIIFLCFLFNLLFYTSAQTDSALNEEIKFSKLFYNIDKNLVGSFTINYGSNYLLAALGSYGLVNSGIDWNIHQTAIKNDNIAYAGMLSVMAGGIVPIAVPLSMYFWGKRHNDNKIQYLALAMGQAAILSFTVSSTIKAITGRKPPGILHGEIENNDFSTDFKFGILNRGAFDGWPSGHTMTAFAMATTLIQFYPENFWIKAGSIAYATCIGLGVSVNIHWFSDAFAGALIGYAIGKTVGKGFANLYSNKSAVNNFNFLILPDGAKLAYRF